MPRGASASNTDPPPQRHRRRQERRDDDRKGGPLWLRLQGYVLPVTLCQDHLTVSTTGVLVSTRTGFPRSEDGRSVALPSPDEVCASAMSVEMPGQVAAEAPHPDHAVDGVGVGGLLG